MGLAPAHMASYALSDLAQLVSGTLVNYQAGTVQCHSLSAQSASVTTGTLFVAVRGFNTDGHAFVGDAFDRGAGAAVVEDVEALAGRPGIVVPLTRIALSRLAAAFYGDPSSLMKVIGVTGTNGKTTTNWIIYQILQQLGVGALRVGTLGSEYLGGTRRDGGLTTPDAPSIHALLAEAFAAGARYAVMEASSHALHQSRLHHVQFDVGVFTNLTRDHLDYHKTFEEYFAAKSTLFDLIGGASKATKAAVVNIDDPYGRRIVDTLHRLGLRDWSFGTDQAAAVRVCAIREREAGMIFEVQLRDRAEVCEVEVPFIGMHNAENVLAALTSCLALGFPTEAILAALPKVAQVPGRLERVGGSGPRVFVDYAHTPDALERVLTAIRPSTEGKLWVVFGCGGDRDRGKRPEMGLIAGRLADEVVVTSDNPRTEAPERIIDDIVKSGVTPRIVEVDRRLAIGEAIRQAQHSDTVLIAGKGHEDYQIIGNTTVPFSDQAVALDYLEQFRSTPKSSK